MTPASGYTPYHSSHHDSSKWLYTLPLQSPWLQQVVIHPTTQSPWLQQVVIHPTTPVTMTPASGYTTYHPSHHDSSKWLYTLPPQSPWLQQVVIHPTTPVTMTPASGYTPYHPSHHDSSKWLYTLPPQSPWLQQVVIHPTTQSPWLQQVVIHPTTPVTMTPASGYTPYHPSHHDSSKR